MRNGYFSTCKAPFGYSLVNRKLGINISEALAIRLIFDRHLQGHSMDGIAKEVIAYGFPIRDKKSYWQVTSIRYALRNEKYIGDSRSQRTYMTEALLHQQKRNGGERKQYTRKETHPSIISQDTFERAQKFLGVKNPRIPPESKDVSPFAQHIFCGDCSAIFKREP